MNNGKCSSVGLFLGFIADLKKKRYFLHPFTLNRLQGYVVNIIIIVFNTYSAHKYHR